MTKPSYINLTLVFVLRQAAWGLMETFELFSLTTCTNADYYNEHRRTAC